MKKKLIIIGGGLTGFRCALSAFKSVKEFNLEAEIEIMLINPTTHLEIPEDAGTVFPTGPVIELEKYLSSQGIYFLLGKTEIVRPENNSVMVRTSLGLRKIHYDYLVMAAGASNKPLDFAGHEETFQVNDLTGLERLHNHLGVLAARKFSAEGDYHLAVAGGITQFSDLLRHFIEEISSRAKVVFKVVVIGKTDRPAQLLMDSPAEIRIIAGEEISKVEETILTLHSGEQIKTSTVVWTPIRSASTLGRFFNAERDEIGRLKVNQFGMLEGYENVFIAGFSADIKYKSAECVDKDNGHEGRMAGMNAVRAMIGMEQVKVYDKEDLPVIKSIGTETSGHPMYA